MPVANFYFCSSIYICYNKQRTVIWISGDKIFEKKNYYFSNNHNQFVYYFYSIKEN